MMCDEVIADCCRKEQPIKEVAKHKDEAKEEKQLQRDDRVESLPENVTERLALDMICRDATAEIANTVRLIRMGKTDIAVGSTTILLEDHHSRRGACNCTKHACLE